MHPSYHIFHSTANDDPNPGLIFLDYFTVVSTQQLTAKPT
jgi:hypothetical protein